jgi:hypothetical protein
MQNNRRLGRAADLGRANSFLKCHSVHLVLSCSCFRYAVSSRRKGGERIRVESSMVTKKL